MTSSGDFFAEWISEYPGVLGLLPNGRDSGFARFLSRTPLPKQRDRKVGDEEWAALVESIKKSG